MKTSTSFKTKYVAKNDLKHDLSQYPNFSASGSIKGMKDKYYGKDATLIKSGNYIYNVPIDVYNKY